jgi:predicted kinase
MKQEIKKILREDMRKNALGYDITRPTQELVIIRGIPGSGKSTLAKSLVKEGVIHSTDSVIESWGNYNEFFNKMVETKDFTPLSRAHSKNLSNTLASLKESVSPVVFDNTNIKMNEPKRLVELALKCGLDENNIKIVDIGTNGLTAEQLAKRNSHGVPLEKIQSMMASHKGQGEMTVKKILESKDMYKTSDVLYSCVLLDKPSHIKLLSETYPIVPPKGWDYLAHHMTIAFGKGVKDKSELGKKVTLRVFKVGISDMAMAVQVDGYPSEKPIPHITIAVNKDEGGKSKDSNDITKWQDIKPFYITGVVADIGKDNMPIPVSLTK